jgi:NADH-quinone oxidoreductase subunit L
MVTAGVYLIVRSNPIFNRPRGAARRRDRRRDHAALRRDRRLREGRHQEGARRVDDEPDRLHDPGRRPRARGYAFAIMHLLTHGFFKAGMFLGAGSVMHAMNDETDMRRFGGCSASCR